LLIWLKEHRRPPVQILSPRPFFRTHAFVSEKSVQSPKHGSREFENRGLGPTLLLAKNAVLAAAKLPVSSLVKREIRGFWAEFDDPKTDFENSPAKTR
jgi:hypothetical protein